MSALQLCTFDVGPLRVGVDVERVQEVRRGDQITPVPLAPASVAGIVNLRGQIVSVIDARARFGLGRATGERVHVVIRSGAEAVILAVDAEHDVLSLDDGEVEAAPETVDPAIASLLLGVHKIDAALLLVIDPDRILSVS